MVIFDDLHKLLLYQKLNLGFECQICKRKFYNRLDHLQHTSSCRSEPLKCPKCGKIFGHQQILRLHMQFHNLSETPNTSSEVKVTTGDVKTECVELTDSYNEEKTAAKQRTQINTAENVTEYGEQQKSLFNISEALQVENKCLVQNNLSTPIAIFESPKKRSSQAKAKPKQAKKRIGLTKVRMEDCLRCDDCSCIYIDEKDYYKHMRNFHQLDGNNTPIPQQKSKRKCRSCCKQCRGGRAHCTSIKRPRATQRASNLIFKINMRDNIKDRWTKMVSQQLSECPMPEFPLGSNQPEDIKPDPDSVTIKTEPESSIDLSYLLSQVEVKIKTEPVDDYFM